MRIQAIIYFGFCTLISISFCDVSFARSVLLDSKLEEKQIEYKSNKNDIKTNEVEIRNLELEIDSLQSIVDNNKVEYDKAKEKFEEIQNFILNNPEKEISSAMEKNNFVNSKRKYEVSFDELNRKEQILSKKKKKQMSEKRTLSDLEVEIDEIKSNIAYQEFLVIRKRLEIEQTVFSRGEVSCGDMSISQCRITSLDLAKRNAIEKTSVNVIKSYTKVTNFELQDDVIESRVSGEIISFEIVDSGFIGESGYYHNIKAVVKPIVPEDLFTSKYKAVHLGKIDFVEENDPEQELSVAPKKDVMEQEDRGGDLLELQTDSINVISGYFSPSATITYRDSHNMRNENIISGGGLGVGIEYLFKNNISIEYIIIGGNSDKYEKETEIATPKEEEVIGEYTGQSASILYNWYFVSQWFVNIGIGYFINNHTIYEDTESNENDLTLTVTGVGFVFNGGYVFQNRIILKLFFIGGIAETAEGTMLEDVNEDEYSLDETNETIVGFVIGYNFKL